MGGIDGSSVDIVYNYVNGDGNDVVNTGGNILLNITNGSITGFESYNEDWDDDHLIAKVGNGNINVNYGTLKIYNNGKSANVHYNPDPNYSDDNGDYSDDDFIYFDKNLDLEPYENDGSFSIKGAAGNDTIYLPDASSRLFFDAGAGNDIINTHYGTIIYSNGNGNDTVDFENYVLYTGDDSTSH